MLLKIINIKVLVLSYQQQKVMFEYIIMGEEGNLEVLKRTQRQEKCFTNRKQDSENQRTKTYREGELRWRKNQGDLPWKKMV